MGPKTSHYNEHKWNQKYHTTLTQNMGPKRTYRFVIVRTHVRNESDWSCTIQLPRVVNNLSKGKENDIQLEQKFICNRYRHLIRVLVEILTFYLTITLSETVAGIRTQDIVVLLYWQHGNCVMTKKMV